jgi:hypothetical protein
MGHREDVPDQLQDPGPTSVPASPVLDPEQQVASPRSSDDVPDDIQQLPPQVSPPSPPLPHTRLHNNIVKTKDFSPDVLRYDTSKKGFLVQHSPSSSDDTDLVTYS